MTEKEKKAYVRLFKRFCKDEGIYHKFFNTDDHVRLLTGYRITSASIPFNTFGWGRSEEGYGYWFTRCLLFCDKLIDYTIENKGTFKLEEIKVGARDLIETFRVDEIYDNKEYMEIFERHKKKYKELSKLT